MAIWLIGFIAGVQLSFETLSENRVGRLHSLDRSSTTNAWHEGVLLVQREQNRHRCEIEIAASLLRSVAKKRMRKTWMMNAANLNHVLMEKQLGRLLGCGFITQVDGSEVYELTEDGRAFLDEYVRFKRLEDMFLRARRAKEEGEESID